MSHSPEDDDRLRALLEECFLQLEGGSVPDLDLLTADRPDLRPRLERLLANETDFMSRLIDEPEEGVDLPQIAGYRLQRRIGAGGMGEVYAATDPTLGRKVALKIVRRVGADEASLRRLRREAEITAALDHPNIVPVFAVGETGDFAWIAMKLLSGPSLAGLADSPPPGNVAVIGIEIARALHAAHLEGIIHRDVKPANVVMDHGTAVLCDFGLARALDRASLTQSNSVAGTLPYMAPEQLEGSRAADPRTDIYGLCATLYEALCGRPPFTAPSPEALIRQIVDRDVPPLRLAKEDRDLATIIHRGLEKDPRRRFLTAEALAQELERYLRGDPIESRPSGFLDSTIRRLRRRPMTTATVAVLLVIILGLGIWVSAAAIVARRYNEGMLLRSVELADNGNAEAAAELLADLKQRAPGMAGIPAEARRQSALMLIEDLADQVQSFIHDETASLDDGLRTLESLGGFLLCRPLSDMTRVAAALHAGNDGAAGKLLDRIEADFGTSRATAAFRRVATPAAPIATDLLPPPKKLSLHFGAADDAAFAALALTMKRVSFETRLDEVSKALDLDPTSYRARYARAVLYHETGQYAAAYASWLGLQRDRRHSPSVVCNLALDALAEGRTDTARAHITSILGKRPHRLVTRRALEVLAATDAALFRSELDLAIKADPADPWLHYRMGVERMASGRFAEAKDAECEAIRVGERDPQVLNAARRQLLTIEIAIAGFSDIGRVAQTDDERKVAERLLEQAEGAVRTAETRYARADAHVTNAILLRVLGRKPETRAALDRALESEPDNPTAQLHWLADIATRCIAFGSGESDPLIGASADSLSADIEKARRLVTALSAPRRGGLRRASDEQIEAALTAAIYLSIPAKDLPALNESAEDLREFLENTRGRAKRAVPAEVAENIKRLRAAFGQ